VSQGRGEAGREAGPGAGGEGEFLLPERRARIDAVVAGRTRTLTVVMEAFADPQNVNAVLRTAEALGVQEVHVVEGPQKRYDRNKKISQNADKWLDVVRWKDTAECLGALKARGFRLYATHLDDGATTLSALSFAEPVALVFGNEHRGVSEAALELADARYAIPMTGFSQSLNVSVAAAISLFRAVERREAERGRHADLPEAEAEALKARFYTKSVKQRTRIAKAAQAAERRALHGARRGRHGGTGGGSGPDAP
jgi:tRNA (guanosine-2'-O-)-methyltransferase